MHFKTLHHPSPTPTPGTILCITALSLAAFYPQKPSLGPSCPLGSSFQGPSAVLLPSLLLLILSVALLYTLATAAIFNFYVFVFSIYQECFSISINTFYIMLNYYLVLL